MSQRAMPAAFMRGGTSKALMLKAEDVPADRDAWPELFCALMGSPDPYGRQLNGMGGGISSLSKICIVGRSARDDADVDYTFVQVQVHDAAINLEGNCGNMTSAVGPFAVDAGMIAASGDQAMVRIFNTNTRKIIHATFPVRDGRALYDGDLEIPGVAGRGAAIKLDFIAPGGASTGRLSPTGRAADIIDTPRTGPVRVSMVDAANACVFVPAAELALTGQETPDQIEARPDLLARLEAIRTAGSVAMGVAPDLKAAGVVRGIPFVALVAPPADFETLSGARIASSQCDLVVRAMSNGQAHRALPLTVALCAAVAARLEGGVVAAATAGGLDPGRPLRLGMPSGVLTVAADVERSEAGEWRVRSGSFYRTARLLYEGRVFAPSA